MKLLKRDEVQSVRSSERKTEIDTGLAIARRIDELRETLAKEENNYRKFHEETTKILQEDIDSLIRRRDELKK